LKFLFSGIINSVCKSKIRLCRFLPGMPAR
jgi:hypothetical protein